MAEEKVVIVRDVEYIVSTDGKVYSAHDHGATKYHQEISQRANADGYMQVTVGKTGNRSPYRVHRMVAEAFIPNPDNLPEINHKDNNRANNCVENLEWCTHCYNIHYAIDSGNHICTQDISGANNPNYGNHILSDRYKADPELAKQIQGRSGAKNGRAKGVKLLDIITGEEHQFEYLREASLYLIENELTRAKNVDSVLNRLSCCAKSEKMYKNRFVVEFID